MRPNEKAQAQRGPVAARCRLQRLVRPLPTLSLIFRLTCHSTATPWKPRQVILYFKPRNLTVRPNMILGCYPLRIVQTSHGYLHSISKDFLMHGEGTSAFRAEPALSISRRPKLLWFPRHPSERISRKVHKTQAGGTRMLSAVLTMADNTPDRSRGRAIPYCSA